MVNLFIYYNNYDEDSYLWEAPVAKPDAGQVYTWDEQTTSWNLLGDSE